MSALDALHVDEIEAAFEHLESLERAATPAPWRECISSGGVVGPDGDLVFAAKDRDVRFLVALRNNAARLIFQCRNIHAIVADLDAVHEALGIDYNEQAAPRVRDLVEARKKLETARYLVDTSRDIHEAIERILTRAGKRIVPAAGGDKAGVLVRAPDA